MPRTEDNTLDRHDALQWCLNNLKEFTALGIIGRGYPEGWTFTSDNGELLLCHTFHDPIKRVDFDMMTKPKEGSVFTAEGVENLTIRHGALTQEEVLKLSASEGSWQEDEWVPEVGEECLLLNNQEYGVEYGLDVIGKEVKLISVNKNSIGVDVATVEYEHGFYCFKLDMLHPPKNQEEIDREEDIKALAEIIDKGFRNMKSLYEVAESAIDAGYKKPRSL